MAPIKAHNISSRQTAIRYVIYWRQRFMCDDEWFISLSFFICISFNWYFFFKLIQFNCVGIVQCQTPINSSIPIIVHQLKRVYFLYQLTANIGDGVHQVLEFDIYSWPRRQIFQTARIILLMIAVYTYFVRRILHFQWISTQKPTNFSIERLKSAIVCATFEKSLSPWH